MRKQCIALVLAGGMGTRLSRLTKEIPKPAVPFAGRYRLIDFTLSNCCNSELDSVGVLMPLKPFPLPKQIVHSPTASSRLYSLPPESGEQVGGYSGTANAVYANTRFIEQFNPEYVLIASGDHVYKMDYRRILNYHIEKKADASIAVIRVPWAELSRFGIVSVSSTGAIEEFIEKPIHAHSNLASMGVYVFSWPKLKQCLEIDAADLNSSHDFGKNVIPAMLSQSERVYAYPFTGYWKDVGTVEALYSAQMDLLKQPEMLNLQDREWPIYSTDEALLAKRFSVNQASAAIIDSGCSVWGNVHHAVVCSNVHISPEATVRDAVIMTGAYIGPGSHVERAIIGPHAVLERGSIVCGGIAGFPQVAVVRENVVVSPDRGSIL